MKEHRDRSVEEKGQQVLQLVIIGISERVILKSKLKGMY